MPPLIPLLKWKTQHGRYIVECLFPFLHYVSFRFSATTINPPCIRPLILRPAIHVIALLKEHPKFFLPPRFLSSQNRKENFYRVIVDGWILFSWKPGRKCSPFYDALERQLKMEKCIVLHILAIKAMEVCCYQSCKASSSEHVLRSQHPYEREQGEYEKWSFRSGMVNLVVA